MKAKTRRKLEMGAHAFIFSRLHPDPSPGYAAALEHLEDCLRRATAMAGQQYDGILQVRTAAARKRDLRRTLRRAHLSHLKRVAHIAEEDVPELHRKFVLPRGTIPYLTFRNVARCMVAEAESRKDVMVKHGLADVILESLVQSLDELDHAVERGIKGRQAHVGASAALDDVADEVVLIVKTIGGINRFRFGNEPGLLAEWASVSHVVSAPHSPAA